MILSGAHGARAEARAGSAHRLPLALVVAAFAVSRLAIYAAGVRFDASSLPTFSQYIDPSLLKSRLLESVYYLHSQPPLYNLGLGIGLKLFPDDFASAARAAYIAMGLATAVAFYALLVRVGLGRWPSAALSILLLGSPAVLLYENWLFYEYPVMLLLVLSALALNAFVARPTLRRGTLFFGLLADLVYLRSTFQAVWLALVIVLLLVVMRGSRATVLKACALPVAIVALLYAKNAVVFGVAGTSSWLGMNLAQVAYRSLPSEERLRLVEDGTLSRVSLADPFSPLTAYRGIVQPSRKRGIPVLDEELKASGDQNLGNIAYVHISRQYLRDSIRLVREKPIVYLRGVKAGLKRFATPASDDIFVHANRDKIQPYERFFNWIVYVRTPYVSRTAWGIMLAYAAALLYGLLLAVRALRRRNGSAELATLAFVWLSAAYVTVVVAFGEVGQNQRIRFFLDPLVLVLVAALLREAWTAARAQGKATVLLEDENLRKAYLGR